MESQEIKKILKIDKDIEKNESEANTLKYNRDEIEKKLKEIFCDSLRGQDLFYGLHNENVELWISDLNTENDYGVSIRLLNVKNYTEDVLKQMIDSVKSIDEYLEFSSFELNRENKINLHYYKYQ